MSIETTRARFGYLAELVAGTGGSLDVRFLGKTVPVPHGLAFSPETNSRGDLAYAAGLADGIKSSLGASDIWLNEERIATNRQILDLAMTDTALAWLETTPTGTAFVRYDLLTGALTTEILAIRGQRVVADGDVFVINGVHATTGNTVVVTAGAAGVAVVTDYGDQSIFLAGHSDDASLVRVTGDASGRLLYAALDRALRPETEEFTGVGNDAGRLAWHQSYRLLALADLATVTGDAELKVRAAGAVMQMLQQADADGNFPSTRYSLGDEPVSYTVHSGWIYHAAFQSWDFLSAAQRQSLVEQATRSFDSFESDWMSYGYRFTPHGDFYLDGVVQAFNMQSAMGLLALDLHRATGDARFLDRAEAVFDLITAELVVQDGTAVWYFWSTLFTDGWSEGTFDSTNAPSHAPIPATLEDVHHSIITLPFLLEAGRALGRNVIDVEAVFASIQLGGLNFAAELNGSVGGYEFLPPWPDAEGLWPYLMRELPSVLPHYDQGAFDWMYAGSARRSGVTASTQIVVETLDPQTGQVTGSRTLTGPAEILAYIEANAYSRSPVASESIDLGTEGNDTHAGTAGADSIRLLDGNDTASMGDGNDVVMGDFGDDMLFGEGDDDALYGGFGADVLNGGDGDDLLSGQAGDDILIGGEGADSLTGGGGEDTADYSGSVDRISVNLTTGEGLGGQAHGDRLFGVENLIGTNSSFTDFLTGDDNPNAIYGLAGDDELHGLGGDDVLIGGEGADSLTGGDGRDTADYSGSAERISVNLLTGEGLGGHAHGDRLSGVENLIGTNSSFTDFLTGDDNANAIHGLGGDDELYGLGGNDTLTGGEGDDRVDGGAGDDVLIGGEGADSLTGGGGEDTADYCDSAERISVNLMTGEGLGGDAHGDRLSGVENLIGTNSSFTDFLTGDDNANAIHGLAGDDELYGLGGNDTLTGGEGDDRVDGGDGDDILIGGFGADLLNGGGGRDTADYSGSAERISVNLMTGEGLGGDAHGDRLFGVENLIGTNSSFTDFLTGDDNANAIYGLAGDDELYGLGGDDALYGDFGADVLNGGAGDDLLSGLAGDDVLIGGEGADSLTGGDGRDTADYSGSVDRISVNLMTGEGLGGHAHGDRLSGIEKLIGTNSSFTDFLTGDDNPNAIHGLAGDDELYGLGGDDVLIGGFGADVLTGGDGRDTADYSGSAERISVNLMTGEGLGGQAHGDRLSGVENLIGTNSSFTDFLTGDDNANAIHGLAGDDELYGLGGDDVLIGGEGADSLIGGVGRDTADYSGSAERISVNLMTGEGLGGDAHGDRLFGIENLIGTNSSFTDFLTGDDSANAIYGLAGDDELYGLGGDDVLIGGFGSDVLNGGVGDDLLSGQAGEDVLIGGEGADSLTGGDGRDTADYSGSVDRIAVNLTTGEGLGGDAHGDRLFGIENLIGTNSSFTDFLTGDDNPNAIYGLAGDDELYGMGGNDNLTGGEGDDRIDGGDGYDVVIVSGGASQYVLQTNGDGFILMGPDGEDSLTRIEAIRFEDGHVLELSSMFGQDAHVPAWEAEWVSEALLSGGTARHEPAAPLDRRSSHMPTLEDQGQVGDHHHGGGWGADDWAL